MQTWQIFMAATRISHVTALLSHNSNASQEMHPHPHPHPHPLPHPAPLLYASVNVLCAVCTLCVWRAFRGPTKIEGTKENHKSYRKLLQLLEFICKCCAAEISPICFVAFPFSFSISIFFFFLELAKRSKCIQRDCWDCGATQKISIIQQRKAEKSHSLNDADEILMKYRFMEMPHTHTHTHAYTVRHGVHTSIAVRAVNRQ